MYPTSKAASKRSLLSEEQINKLAETFIERVRTDDPSLNPNNPLENNDFLAETPKFWQKFVEALKTNTKIKKIGYPTNKTIVEKKSTMLELATALQSSISLGNVNTLKIFTETDCSEIVDALIYHVDSFEDVSIKWAPLNITLAQKLSQYIRMSNNKLKGFTLNVGREGTDTDTCGVLLAEAVEVNTSIQVLKLRSNNFEEKSGIHFGKVIENNTHLTYLDVSYNRMGISGFNALFSALSSAPVLQTLILKDCDIPIESIKTLAYALRNNRALKKLSLYANTLKPVSASILSESLKENTTLTYLDLYGNSLKTEGTEELAKMLKVNSGLSHLSLQSNHIPLIGIQKLAESLHQNHSLKSLNLANNSITNEAAICKMLSVNSTLTKLDLRFTNAKRNIIEEALKKRKQPLEIVWLYN